MNRNILFLLLIALAGAISCEQSATKTNVAPTGRPTVRELRHVVLFKFKDGLPAYVRIKGKPVRRKLATDYKL